jgi:hypothetical protein
VLRARSRRGLGDYLVTKDNKSDPFGDPVVASAVLVAGRMTCGVGIGYPCRYRQHVRNRNQVAVSAGELSFAAPQLPLILLCGAKAGRGGNLLGKIGKHPPALPAELYLFECGIPVRGIADKADIALRRAGSRGVANVLLHAADRRQVGPMDYGMAGLPRPHRKNARTPGWPCSPGGTL